MTIEYGGFKAVYDFIPNPLGDLPLIAKCEFELGGPMGYLGGSPFCIACVHMIITQETRMYQKST